MAEREYTNQPTWTATVINQDNTASIEQVKCKDINDVEPYLKMAKNVKEVKKIDCAS